MIIINADDLGRSVAETDAAFECQAAGRVTSMTAMVFMCDSQRAAHIVSERGIDVGLHLNLAEGYTGSVPKKSILERQERIVRFLQRHRLAYLAYNPALRGDFEFVYRSQVEEFARLYGRQPTHIDGHKHLHLAANVLFDRIIEDGRWVRPSFYFWPGERRLLNRAFRHTINRWLARRYRVVDHFFALSQSLTGERWARIIDLARSRRVEVSAHPVKELEYDFLMSDRFATTVATVESSSYRSLGDG